MPGLPTTGASGVAARVQARKLVVFVLSPLAFVAATWKAYWALTDKPVVLVSLAAQEGGEVYRALQQELSYLLPRLWQPPEDQELELKGIKATSGAFRKPGALAGKVWLSDDFDTLPEDMLDAIEQDAA